MLDDGAPSRRSNRGRADHRFPGNTAKLPLTSAQPKSHVGLRGSGVRASADKSDRSVGGRTPGAIEAGRTGVPPGLISLALRARLPAPPPGYTLSGRARRPVFGRQKRKYRAAPGISPSISQRARQRPQRRSRPPVFIGESGCESRLTAPPLPLTPFSGSFRKGSAQLAAWGGRFRAAGALANQPPDRLRFRCRCFASFRFLRHVRHPITWESSPIRVPHPWTQYPRSFRFCRMRRREAAILFRWNRQRIFPGSAGSPHSIHSPAALRLARSAALTRCPCSLCSEQNGLFPVLGSSHLRQSPASFRCRFFRLNQAFLSRFSL